MAKQGDLVPDKAAVRAGGRVLVSTDITRFYGSIYTHSVPWALHGKVIAKRKRRDYSLFGNRIDRALRLISAGQTIGIPIGPDPSLVIAEVLLAGVDLQLAKQFPPPVALLAMHAETLGLLEKPLDKQAWVALAVKESLYDEHWLLAYEGTKKGWLPVSPSFIQADSGFAFLWQHDVEFYDTRRISQPKPSGVPPSIGFAPSFY